MTDLAEFRRKDVGPAELFTALPSGTVTFLLTDIEGSTRAWETHGPAMAKAITRHCEILDAAITRHGGVRPIEQGEGDSLVAAFARASDAVAAALEAQRALLEEDWPGRAAITVRMALHTDEAQLREERYYAGPSIIRCARLRALAHGGQVLISNTTADLLADGLPEGASLLPLGVHRLRDLRQAERVFQLSHPALPARFPPLRSLDVLPNNLPVQLTSFIGREKELAEVAALLDDHRLVTLVGAGGCGKTRLAAQIAAEGAANYPDGLWWVDLASLPDPEFVPRAVMSALGLLDTRGFDPPERITRYIGDQRMLLIFDNCEHVLAAAAGLLETILRACPNLAALTTSREPLGVPGEVAWRVPPLSLPAQAEQTEGVLASEAVRLFLDRAADARPAFRIDGDNASTIASICARLDGLPLAIELSAARVRSLSPERILAGLADRFRLLTGGARTTLPRQQTLQASVEWSHDLLTDAEQAVFRRLAPFSGSFSLEAAEEVAAGDPVESWEVLTLLSDLVDKSLVVFDGDRYRLLQTVGAFAQAQLLDSGEADSVRSRHAAYFVAVAEAAGAQIEESPRKETLDSLEDDHDNLRSALDWVLAEGDGESALRLVVALTHFWEVHGHYTEALGWYRRVLAAVPADRSPNRVRALARLAILSAMGMEISGGYGMAEAQEAATLAEELGDSALGVRPLFLQGALLGFAAPDQGLAALGQVVESARQAADKWVLNWALFSSSFHHVFHCDRPELATPALDELRDIAGRSASSYWQAWPNVSAGIAAVRRARFEEARQLLEFSLAQSFEVANPMLEMYSVGFLWEVPHAQGDYQAARSLLAHSIARQDRAGVCLRLEWLELSLAHLAISQDDLATAHRQFEATEAVVRRGGLPFLIAYLASLKGRAALEEDDLGSARTAFEEAMTIAQQLATPWLLVAVSNVGGRLARAEGDLSVAEDLHHQALALVVEHGFRGAGTDTLEALGSLAAAGESHSEAVRILGAAHALREATGQQRPPVDQSPYEADISQLRSRLGEDAFEQAWKEGAALSLEEAAAYASRARGERKRPSTGWAALTPTEVEVVALAAQGLTNAEIGQRLFISAGTAKVHLSHVYAKLGVANRAELAAQATARGIGRPS